ncbi:sensor histidine kinase [Pseudorhodobacter turbinis]|uniref:C4-dicarboxylate transport sensor protein DctB n=1 Tax=Pseudorhodobacter turbinis TaxID=2500533 RepID=A0A4P8EH47_9RHOB|nr:sensor histidine kinase [Pseudorhodobacter turbinis]
MLGFITLAALVILAAGYFAYSLALRGALQETARRGDNTLQLATTSLRGKMERFEHLPQFLAEHALIKSIAQSPKDAGVVARTNAYLKSTQQLLGASDIYFMDASGVTRAASNFDSEISFVGGDFGFRPYFTEAIKGGLGRYFALGTTSGKRGYYFGAPVIAEGAVAGVLVIKIDLDSVEQDWIGSDDALIVTDADGIIFFSSRDEWRYTALAQLTRAEQLALIKSRRYGAVPLSGFPLKARQEVAGQTLLTVQDGHSYLALIHYMTEADWTIRVMLDAAPAKRQALLVAVMMMLTLGLGMTALAAVLQHRARLQERITLQQTARNQLEARVKERTSELATVNEQLGAEVNERRLAEKNLRQAQADLVQAAKLAALGQMSAALSHEFNQPLGAARTYADNANVLIERGRHDEARGNLDRILSLIDRMTSISRRLHSFARAPGQKLGHVSVAEAVEAASEIAQLRLRSAEVTLEVSLPDNLPLVVAGPVRLQQVLVNLLTNAADAAETAQDRRIHISAQSVGTGVYLHIRDHGDGVPPGLTERIFDPFFSTKGVGKGLGLGLSISYNIIKDFGGILRVEPAEGGGAVFVIELRASETGGAA